MTRPRQAARQTAHANRISVTNTTGELFRPSPNKSPAVWSLQQQSGVVYSPEEAACFSRHSRSNNLAPRSVLPIA